ncbi:MAG: hypothetical protein M5U28_02450 [Sandaracinaceae bacterium]|nr:hypothetical protein [Sandaracinaceae bacterium]
MCRASAGPCDLAESCNGSGPSCPTDAFRSSSFVCRNSAGPCDVAESCTGSSAPCPTDAFVSSGTVCDATISGPCDLADVCTGSSASCPARYASSTTVCRASGTGDTQCDPPERCTGSSATCPANYVEPNGTWCNGPNCGFESCNAGVCTGGFTCTMGRTCQCGGEVCLGMGESCP